jgi:diguanylate cyclase (GGDEF)-like protein
LTGVLNKFALREFAAAELERLRRYPHPLSAAYLDLDNFKYVNDRFGHAVGDELLIAVAVTLRQVLRKTDVVARLGGDEFVVVMVETDARAARKAFLKAQAALLAAMRAREWPVTFSIGVVTFTEPPASVEAMLEQADAAMYHAKHRGKNRVAYRTVAAEVPDHEAVGERQATA